MVGRLKRGGNASAAIEPGRVGWHELFAADGKKAFAFYSELFGWQPGAGAKDLLESYQLVAVDGHTIGGMFNKLPRAPVPFWLYYFEVADIAVAIEAVEKTGGRIVQGPLELENGSWIVRCIDPQGAMFSLQGRSSQNVTEPAAVSELSWAADWGGFTSRGKVVAKPKR
jgi:predicted enzyme related to lactoylglutathione lyase